MAFAAKAMSLGMNVSRPYAETCYDFVVECRGRLARIQVKSGWKEWHGGYPVKMSNYLRPYRPGEVDFIVVYIPPEDTWYVVPVAAVSRRRTTSFYPNVAHSRGALERYREAWELLTKQPCHPSLGAASSRRAQDLGEPPRRRARRASLPATSHQPLATAERAARSRRARAAWTALGDFLFSSH